MLLGARQTLIRNSLPYKARLEYIYSPDGQNLIDTGIIPTINDHVSISLCHDYYNGFEGVVSSKYGTWNASPNYWFTIKNIISRWQIWAFNNFADLSGLAPTPGYVEHISINLPNGSVSITNNNGSKTWNIIVGTPHTEQPTYVLFDTAPAVGYGSSIYKFKIVRNGVLIQSLIPVLDYDDTPCMYDEVSHKFFYNQGTGAFVAGPRVDDVDYTAKSYIQDGLVAMWDGIENAGWGVHDANATVWRDLIGSLDITIPSSATIADKYLKMTSGSTSSVNTFTIDTTSDYAVELVFAAGDSHETADWVRWRFGYLLGASFATQYFKFGNYWGGNRVFNTPATYNRDSSTLSTDGRVVTATFNIKQSESKFDIYYNGAKRYVDQSTDSTKSAYKIEFITGERAQYTFRANIYNRLLSASEIAYNYSIDKARFILS